MTDKERKTIHIPEITRVEGHSAVHVDITDGQVSKVELEVFEGTRFFEKIVVGHGFDEMPHITSRVCAICSTGHVLASIFALESGSDFEPDPLTTLLRHLMHLGMIIESHATHIYALALPDYVGAKDLISFATEHPKEFENWTTLRNLGSEIQTVLGGRPFHPVNLHVGGFSRLPAAKDLLALAEKARTCSSIAVKTAELLQGFKPPVARTTEPAFMALIPDSTKYGYFGTVIRSTEGWQEPIASYKHFLHEQVVSYSHAKRATVNGKPIMVGSMARLRLFGEKLTAKAREIYNGSPLAQGDGNSLWNNLAQSIEVIDAIEQVCDGLCEAAAQVAGKTNYKIAKVKVNAGSFVGAVECPRGTLYHSYDLDSAGRIIAADLITPSVQNSARIELDIREVVNQHSRDDSANLQANLETLVRAYDPCNTCATHMVSINFKEGPIL